MDGLAHMGAMIAEHRGTCMRRVPQQSREDYTAGWSLPVQSRLLTTVEYAYIVNRLSGMTGHVALLEL